MRGILGALILLVAAVALRFDAIGLRFAPPNPAANLSVWIPARSAPARSAIPVAYRENPFAFLSLAPTDSLQLLPGIGPVIAERIAVVRSGQRSFTKWEDLLAVKGIGPKTLERLKQAASGD